MSDEEFMLSESDHERESPSGDRDWLSNDKNPAAEPGLNAFLDSLSFKPDILQTQTSKISGFETRLSELEKPGGRNKRAGSKKDLSRSKAKRFAPTPWGWGKKRWGGPVVLG